jgi:hypothetical protein
MKTLQKNSIAIKARIVCFSLWVLLAIGLLQTSYVHAQENVGTIIDLSGPLVARKASGVVKVLNQKSTVDQGDILESEKNTYARIKFIDDSEITLKPGTQFKIEAFSYDSAKPESDSSVFSLIKGGLRSITGLLGKRSKEKYKLSTPAATIGIRGTTYVADYVPPDTKAVAAYMASSFAMLESATATDAGGLLLPIQFAPWPRKGSVAQVAQAGGANPSGLNPGLYVQVLDGTISVTNSAGTQDFSAGQFGYVSNFNQPPVVLPSNPGLQFTPPPTFSTVVTANGAQQNAKPEDVDCTVR